MKTLFERLCQPTTLLAAWKVVKEKDSSGGITYRRMNTNDGNWDYFVSYIKIICENSRKSLLFDN